MSSPRRRFHVRHPVVVDIGCGCRRPKLSSFFSPFSSASSSSSKQKAIRSNKYPDVFSPSTASLSTKATTMTMTTNASSSSFSPSNGTSSPSQGFSSPKQSTRRGKGTRSSKKAVVEESVAVEKDSSDPYLDFRDSMLQMIVEKEIYNWDDLTELLRLFLSLNSPYHHPLILQAFAEIWHGVLPPGR